MSKAIDLTNELKAVYASRNLADKKAALGVLIDRSHAKAETKRKALLAVTTLMTAYKLDKFATNYVLSGEGMKVQ